MTWYEVNGKGRVTLRGEDFAVFSRNSAEFTFSDGRTMTAQVNQSGTVEAVSVAPGVVVGTYDHEYIVLARQDQYRCPEPGPADIASQRHMDAGAAGLGPDPYIPDAMDPGSHKPLRTHGGFGQPPVQCTELRAGGAILAVIPIIVLIATGGNFR